MIYRVGVAESGRKGLLFIINIHYDADAGKLIIARLNVAEGHTTGTPTMTTSSVFTELVIRFLFGADAALGNVKS